MDTLSWTKEAIIYNGEKTISLMSGAGKMVLVKKWCWSKSGAGQPLVKE